MKSSFKKKAIIIGGSKGIGKSISTNLKKAGYAVTSCSRKEVDTAKLHSVDTFIKKNKSADLIVLNSGGPPPKKFKQLPLMIGENILISSFLAFF